MPRIVPMHRLALCMAYIHASLLRACIFCAVFVCVCVCRNVFAHIWQPGNYYLFNGGASNNCPYAPCTNAHLGQKYTGYALDKGECPTENCPVNEAPPGFEFASAGSCELTRCTTGTPGTFYTKGCNVSACTNGNVRFVRTQVCQCLLKLNTAPAPMLILI